MLADLEKRYAATGVTIPTWLPTLYSRLYAGAQGYRRAAGEFMRVRETRLGAAALCQGYDTYISGILRDGRKDRVRDFGGDGVR